MNNPLETQVGGDHYKDLPIQPTEFCQRNRLGFCESNVVKYVTRHRVKGHREDLLKAIHYIQILIGLEYPDDEVKVDSPGDDTDAEHHPLKKGEWLRDDDEFLIRGNWVPLEKLGIVGNGNLWYEPDLMSSGRRKVSADIDPGDGWRMLVEGEDVIEPGDEYKDSSSEEWTRKLLHYGNRYRRGPHGECRRRVTPENPQPDKDLLNIAVQHGMPDQVRKEAQRLLEEKP